MQNLQNPYSEALFSHDIYEDFRHPFSKLRQQNLSPSIISSANGDNVRTPQQNCWLIQRTKHLSAQLATPAFFEARLRNKTGDEIHDTYRGQELTYGKAWWDADWINQPGSVAPVSEACREQVLGGVVHVGGDYYAAEGIMPWDQTENSFVSEDPRLGVKNTNHLQAINNMAKNPLPPHILEHKATFVWEILPNFRNAASMTNLETGASGKSFSQVIYNLYEPGGMFVIRAWSPIGPSNATSHEEWCKFGKKSATAWWCQGRYWRKKTAVREWL